MLRLARVRPNLTLQAPVLLCLVIESLYYAGLPFSFQYVIDVGLLGNDRRTLVLLISGLAAGAVLVALLGFLRDYLYARLTARVLNDVRAAMFDHLQTLSLGFFTANRAGDILARFSTDISTIEKAAATVVSWVVMYSQTIAPWVVTSNIRPPAPAVISVLPFGSRCALLMFVLKNLGFV